MYACKWLGAITLCLTATLRRAPVSAPSIYPPAPTARRSGSRVYLCSQPPERLISARSPCRGSRIVHWPDKNLPLIVVSHGRRGNSSVITTPMRCSLTPALSLQPSIIPAITVLDLSRTDDLSIYVERPNDIKTPDRFHGRRIAACFQHRPRTHRHLRVLAGGYTGLAVIGANPDWASATDLCQQLRPGSASKLRKGIPGAACDSRSADQGRRHR